MPLHVERHGAGRAVVLTHGVGDTSATWSSLVPALVASGCGVVTWDLRGHGRSTGFDSYTRDDALADLASVTPPGALHVAHSLGGYLAMALAITRPELVGGLFLVATGPGYRDEAARARWNDYVRASFDESQAAIALQPDSLVMDGLRRIDVPVALVVGERDRRYHDGMAYLARVFATEVAVVPGAGHQVHETHAAEVHALFEAFRAKVPPHAT